MFSDSVEDLAQAHGVPVHVAQRADDALIDAVHQAKPDVILANNWRTWLPKSVFDLPTHGTLNVHDSLLPEYAGFSPVLWALLNRESRVGVTVHRMDETLDGGPIVAQQAIPVGPSATTTELVAATTELIEPWCSRRCRPSPRHPHRSPAGPGSRHIFPQALRPRVPDRLHRECRRHRVVGARPVRPVPERALPIPR